MVRVELIHRLLDCDIVPLTEAAQHHGVAIWKNCIRSVDVGSGSLRLA
jgi:hypothetical protein